MADGHLNNLLAALREVAADAPDPNDDNSDLNDDDPVPSTHVVPAITANRWTPNALIVSGTLTNSSAIAVQITGMDAKGFDEHQKLVTRGSDYTIVHNELAPGETVNFKVALKDDAKQVKFVLVLPSWSQ
jgi:hypothetical protein